MMTFGFSGTASWCVSYMQCYNMHGIIITTPKEEKHEEHQIGRQQDTAQIHL